MKRAATWSLLQGLVTPAGARAGIAMLGLLAGGVCHLAGAAGAGDVVWQVTIVVTVVPLTWEVVRGMVHGDFGVDIIALLAMATALIGGELLAGAIVAVIWADRERGVWGVARWSLHTALPRRSSVLGVARILSWSALSAMGSAVDRRPRAARTRHRRERAQP